MFLIHKFVQTFDSCVLIGFKQRKSLHKSEKLVTSSRLSLLLDLHVCKIW